MPSSSGMLKRASRSSPSPVHRERSWIEYFEEKRADMMRSIRGWATVPDSSALRGMKPQQTVAKTIASNSGAKSASKGQLMKTDRSSGTADRVSPRVPSVCLERLSDPLEVVKPLLLASLVFLGRVEVMGHGVQVELLGKDLNQPAYLSVPILLIPDMKDLY